MPATILERRRGLPIVASEPAATQAESDVHESPARAIVTFGRWLLRAPLFYKILVSNALLIGLVAFATAEAVRRFHVSPESAPPVVLVIGAGILVSFAANGALIRIALAPLRDLERTAARIQAGDLVARTELSPVADRDLRRLARTFNGMIESATAYRRRLRETSARATRAAEEERKRVARELHDGTAQTLAAVRVRLRLARGASDADAIGAAIDRVSAELGEAIEEVRRMARGLRPPALDMLGLAAAVRSLVESAANAAGLDVEVEADPMRGALSADGELALYRILQEALSNVVRHSGASQLEVRLCRRSYGAELRVRDDGRGFTMDATLANGGGLGLFGMQERAAYVGGQVEVTSSPGNGTTVTAMIPSNVTNHA